MRMIDKYAHEKRTMAISVFLECMPGIRMAGSIYGGASLSTVSQFISPFMCTNKRRCQRYPRYWFPS